jgi:hypothetical protein
MYGVPNSGNWQLATGGRRTATTKDVTAWLFLTPLGELSIVNGRLNPNLRQKEVCAE